VRLRLGLSREARGFERGWIGDGVSWVSFLSLKRDSFKFNLFF